MFDVEKLTIYSGVTIVILTLFSVVPSAVAQGKYECRISLKPNAPASCGDHPGVHRCQLYESRMNDVEKRRMLSEEGFAPDFCWSNCLARSGIPAREECASVAAGPSINPEAHENRSGVDKVADKVGESTTKVKVMWGKVKEAAGKTKDALVCKKRTVGNIRKADGDVHINRGLKSIPATIGTILKPGDVITVGEDSQADLDLKNSGVLSIAEKHKFQIPQKDGVCEDKEKKGVFTEVATTITRTIGSWWVKAKSLIKGESFEVKTPTATIGVRG